MQIDQACGRYIRWLLATRDLSPHTIRDENGNLHWPQSGGLNWPHPVVVDVSL
jgi:hypothetical protein